MTTSKSTRNTTPDCFFAAHLPQPLLHKEGRKEGLFPPSSRGEKRFAPSPFRTEKRGLFSLLFAQRKEVCSLSFAQRKEVCSSLPVRRKNPFAPLFYREGLGEVKGVMKKNLRVQTGNSPTMANRKRNRERVPAIGSGRGSARPQFTEKELLL